MYDQYVEEHSTAMDQQSSFKSLTAGGMDHTYKTTKQILKINAESVFAPTITVTNEFGEARVLAFVATSSHTEFKSALQKVKTNLDLYGLPQPEVMFTDNPAADKQFLERVFPSLTKNVVPVEKYEGMEAFVLPEDVAIQVSRDAAGIENVIARIMHDINIHDASDRLVVGFDAEWNVDTSPTHVSQPTAIIQVAYKGWVDILQIGHFNGKLPAALISFLSNDQIIKAGRAVEQDLRRLAKESNSGPFQGALDIAKLAKESRVISDARTSLADLCARILGKTLKKPTDIRISKSWNNATLSTAQTEYAALDALASLYIYTRLVTTQMPGRISENELPGTLVSVHNTDGQLVAHGHISTDIAKIPGAPSITKTRVRVTISNVLVPAALVSLHNNKALGSFGPVPFDIVYARNKVFTRILKTSEIAAQSTSGQIPMDPQPTTDPGMLKLLEFLQEGSDHVADAAAG
ncbi:ribonuclease H-like domain-containing protein [Mycena vulgaris]|nr:ribonuclease H-like domain-containing protein [Mycena vulgaris]